VLILVLSCSHGDVDRPCPRARQGAQVGSACTTGEPPRDRTLATGPQQEETVAAAAVATAATVVVVSALPALVPTAGDRAAVVDVAADDAPPPGWGQWGGQHASAPERTPEVLVKWEDGRVMSQHPAHDAEASTSHAAPPAPDVTVAHPERGPRSAVAPPAHFDEAQAEQVLTVYFGTPNMFITLWFGFVYGTNPPLGTLII
jgi:hypothetical protein